MNHLDLRLRLVHLNLRLSHRDIDVGPRHADDDLRLRDVDSHSRLRLAHQDLGLRLTHRDLRLRLLNRHLRRGLIDAYRRRGLLDHDAGGICPAGFALRRAVDPRDRALAPSGPAAARTAICWAICRCSRKDGKRLLRKLLELGMVAASERTGRTRLTSSRGR